MAYGLAAQLISNELECQIHLSETKINGATWLNDEKLISKYRRSRKTCKKLYDMCKQKVCMRLVVVSAHFKLCQGPGYWAMGFLC